MGDAPEEGVLVEEAKGPRRRCAATREQGTRAGMLRFVVAPDCTAVPDLAATLPGRGIWLSARRDVLEPARARGALARAARGPVQVPPDLIRMIEAGLVRRLAETLGLARRAGQAVAGFAKAREWLEAGRCGLAVQASDGSPAERTRFLSGASGNGGVQVIAPLDAAGLGAVFGRDHVVHVAVQPGRLAELIATDAERLAGVTGRQDILVAPGGGRVTGQAGGVSAGGAGAGTGSAVGGSAGGEGVSPAAGDGGGQVGIPVDGGSALHPDAGGRTGA